MAPNAAAIAVFSIFVALTLLITAWARKRTSSRTDFYAAGGAIAPWQNGLAIAGDYLSAGSFLGTLSVFFTFGLDGFFYIVGAVAAWPVLTCQVAERLRYLGTYTLSDALSARLASGPIRILIALSTLCICGTYLISQIVGAGSVIQLLFHIPYPAAVILIGTLMTLYVSLGGMIATTWIQIVKASLLLLVTLLMAALILIRMQFDFTPTGLLGTAMTRASHSGLLNDPVSALGLAVAFAFGPAGMPHVLMRFFTVRDSHAARRSLVFASSVIILFQLLLIVLGIGCMTLAPASSPGTANTAALLLAQAVGGNVLMGIVAGCVFATILAVVSGLTLAAASAISHDLFKTLRSRRSEVDEKQEMSISRWSTVLIGILTILLGIRFQNQNIGFLATLPLVIAASAHFPVLILALYWKRLTTLGASMGLACGLLLSMTLVILSPKVWVQALGHRTTPFPYEYPTVFTVTIAFLTIWAVSLLDRTPQSMRDRQAYRGLNLEAL